MPAPGVVRSFQHNQHGWRVRIREPRDYPSQPTRTIAYWTQDEDEARFVFRRLKDGIALPFAIREWRALCDAGMVEDGCQV